METATKAQIFARYLGQQIKITAGKDRKLIAVGGIDDELYIKLRLGEAGSKQFVHAEFLKENTASILLTPLSAITDQDAIEIGRIYYSTVTNELYPSVYELKKEGEIIVNGLFKRNALSCIITVQVFQYLQARGYALNQLVIENGKPVTYTVEQLVEADVFKLMDGKEETK